MLYLKYFRPSHTPKATFLTFILIKTKKIGSAKERSRQYSISEKRLLPTKSRSTKHCSIGTREARLKNLYFVLPERYNLLVHTCTDGREQKLAGIRKTTEENDCLGNRECDEVAESLAKNSSCKLKELLCKSVARNRSIVNHFRCKFVHRHVAQHCSIVACHEPFFRCAHKACCRSICLETVDAAATTLTTLALVGCTPP